MRESVVANFATTAADGKTYSSYSRADIRNVMQGLGVSFDMGEKYAPGFIVNTWQLWEWFVWKKHFHRD